MKTMKLNDWVLAHNGSYLPIHYPLDCARLHGLVSGHPDIDEGERITTSCITGVSEDGCIETQSGSVYELGDVEPEYDKKFPDARNILLKRLRDKTTGPKPTYHQDPGIDFEDNNEVHQGSV